MRHRVSVAVNHGDCNERQVSSVCKNLAPVRRKDQSGRFTGRGNRLSHYLSPVPVTDSKQSTIFKRHFPYKVIVVLSL